MKPKYLIIHHTATLRDKTTFEAIRRTHIRKGWYDVGYHFIITGDGTLHEGRGQDRVGAHCRADLMNFKSLGIALTGNFQMTQPSIKQLETLHGIVNQLKKIWEIPSKNVLGHNEVKGAQTACPGKNFIKIVQDLRRIEPKPTQTQAELLQIIKDLKKEKSECKTNLIKCQNKCSKKQGTINELKVEIESGANWFKKIINILK